MTNQIAFKKTQKSGPSLLLDSACFGKLAGVFNPGPSQPSKLRKSLNKIFVKYGKDHIMLLNKIRTLDLFHAFDGSSDHRRPTGSTGQEAILSSKETNPTEPVCRVSQPAR